MSADNYLLVRRHPDGGFGVTMGFASNDEEPEVDAFSTRYDSVTEALFAAHKQEQEDVIEYGTRVHPECGDDWAIATAEEMLGVQHDDHLDYPPYCPVSPTVQVMPDWPDNPLRDRYSEGPGKPLTQDEARAAWHAVRGTCHDNWHVLVGQKLGCACGAVVKRR